MHYSQSTGGFYDVRVHGRNIPNDSIKITREAYDNLLELQASGKNIKHDDTLGVIAVEREAATIQELIASAKNEIRSIRAPMLDALSGIAGRASRSGSDVIAREADALAQRLLDITEDSSLNSAETSDAVKYAGHSEFMRIAESAGEHFSVVFREYLSNSGH